MASAKHRPAAGLQRRQRAKNFIGLNNKSFREALGESLLKLGGGPVTADEIADTMAAQYQFPTEIPVREYVRRNIFGPNRDVVVRLGAGLFKAGPELVKKHKQHLRQKLKKTRGPSS